MTLCDVGAGAGFPSIPIKIIMPSLKITIVDSLAKRLTFLKGLVEKLGLSDVELVHGRAEDVGQNSKYREKLFLIFLIKTKVRSSSLFGKVSSLSLINFPPSTLRAF